jgi:hypothetical protein
MEEHPRGAARYRDVEDQDGDRDGEDAVAEVFGSTLVQSCSSYRASFSTTFELYEGT